MSPSIQQREREKQYLIEQMMANLPGIDPACTVRSCIGGDAIIGLNRGPVAEIHINADQYGYLHAQGYIDEGIEIMGDSNDSKIHRREHKFTAKGLAIIRGDR